MATQLVEDQNSIVVKDKTYSLSVAPNYEDELVQEEVRSVLGQLSLDDITENLDLSVELFYVAYNGVAGARGGTLQSEIFNLQSKLAMLCNECVTTMTTFKDNTQEIIKVVIDTYKALIKGQEGFAVNRLAHCSEYSSEMSKAANGLAEQFKELQVDSTKARCSTIEEEASEHERMLEAEKVERETRAKQKAESANKEELLDQLTAMEQLYQEAKAREEKESTKALVLGMTSAIFGAIGAGLGAYASASNPLASIATRSASATSGTDKSALEAAQKSLEEKKKVSDAAQQKLFTAQDERTVKQNKVDKLNSEITELTKKIASMEIEASGKPDDIISLKKTREAKQQELNAANNELLTANNKVQELETSSKDATAAYAAAGNSLQEMAKSTGQMAAAAASAEESIHQEKMKYLNQKLELEKEKRKSLVALAEYAENIKNLQVVQGTAMISVNSLHAAVEALGKIVGTLTDASLFWDQMAAYCGRMVSQGFQQYIKDLTNPTSGLSIDDRLAEYRDEDFMQQFLKYLCQWVALNGLSGDYLIAANKAQDKASDYVTKSPTIEEAIRRAPELAKNLELIINKDLLESRQASAELEQQKALIPA